MTHYHTPEATEARMERREARAQANAQAQGYTHSRCDECGEVRSLNWLGGECNETDYCGWTCGGVYRPVAAPAGPAHISSRFMS